MRKNKNKIDKEKLDFLLTKMSKKELSDKIDYGYSYVVNIIGGFFKPSDEFLKKIDLLYNEIKEAYLEEKEGFYVDGRECQLPRPQGAGLES
jgi:hypothetical protein